MHECNIMGQTYERMAEGMQTQGDTETCETHAMQLSLMATVHLKA